MRKQRMPRSVLAAAIVAALPIASAVAQETLRLHIPLSHNPRCGVAVDTFAREVGMRTGGRYRIANCYSGAFGVERESIEAARQRTIGGNFAPADGSVAAGFYALIVGVGIYRGTRLTSLACVLRRSTISPAAIHFIFANAGLLSDLITRAGVPEKIGVLLAAWLQLGGLFLPDVNAALAGICVSIETSASIIVLAPILAPVAQHFGIGPVHFGIVIVVELALAMSAPGLGVNLCAACTVARISLHPIIIRLIPFVLVAVACPTVITGVPRFSIGLWDLGQAQ
jgi:TRAP-type C4-dicarboxylate transport system permease large subunit